MSLPERLDFCTCFYERIWKFPMGSHSLSKWTMCDGPDDSESGLSLPLSLYKQLSPKHLSVHHKQPKMKPATVAILLCSAPAFLTQSSGSMPGVRNQFNIETIGRKLKDIIAVDIQKNREILQELVDLQKMKLSKCTSILI